MDSAIAQHIFLKLQAVVYRTHLTSFAGVLGFEVSRYFAINDRACLTRLFFARTGIKPASCKAFSFRNRSQMGSIGRVCEPSLPWKKELGVAS